MDAKIRCELVKLVKFLTFTFTGNIHSLARLICQHSTVMHVAVRSKYCKGFCAFV